MISTDGRGAGITKRIITHLRKCANKMFQPSQGRLGRVVSRTSAERRKAIRYGVPDPRAPSGLRFGSQGIIISLTECLLSLLAENAAYFGAGGKIPGQDRPRPSETSIRPTCNLRRVSSNNPFENSPRWVNHARKVAQDVYSSVEIFVIRHNQPKRLTHSRAIPFRHNTPRISVNSHFR